MALAGCDQRRLPSSPPRHAEEGRKPASVEHKGAQAPLPATAERVVAKPSALPTERPPHAFEPALERARAALEANDADAALVDLAGFALALGLPTMTPSGASTATVGAAKPTAVLPADHPAGYWLLGRVLDRAGRPLDAATAYQAVAERLPVLADAAMLAAGESLLRAERSAEAADAYGAAARAAHNARTALLAAIGQGNALLAADRPEAAGQAYRAALALSLPPAEAADPVLLQPVPRHEPVRDDGARAQALAGMIAAEVESGRLAAAFDLRRQLITELPALPPARAALARLEEAGEPVDEIDAAAVLAAAGEPNAAAARLSAALVAAGGPAVAPGDLVVRAMAVEVARDRAVEAITMADAFLAANARASAAPTVALRRAAALIDLDRPDDALAAWADLAERWPTDGVAAEALWLRARHLDRQDDLHAAADAYSALAARFPEHARAAPSGFRAGFLYWRTGDTAAADEAWRAIAERADRAPDERARAAFWLGRVAKDAGDSAAAARWWRASLLAAPRDGYARRAADRLRAADDASAMDSLDPHAAAAVDGIEDWPAPGAVAAARAAAGEQPLAHRLLAWQGVGDEAAARLSLERLRDGWAAGDPARLVAIALRAREEGWTDLAIGAARAAMARRPEAVPAALFRLAYPVGFDEDVQAAAAHDQIAPALLRALIWQESRWQPEVVSHAGAIGLTQVMPDTGRFIAGRLREAAFDPDMLTTPGVAVRYGAWYLAEQRRAFEGRDAVALAAYNGGPGNARFWWDRAGGDEDAFLELIAFDETRAYVRAVLGAEAVYAALYP